ncbi:hypothetical protein PQQ51_03695 [Paraburkholderia xenovorans]|uniref:hypothetical protein n=1 Tax=Paraburkholderia xenovorans TaxID=36873 RepID=UPI0038B84AF0
MLMRCAFFKGRIKPGMESRFYRQVEDKLVPLWTRFPGAKDVRVIRQRHSDVDDPAIPLAIAMLFDSQDDIDAALASPVRRESQVESRVLIDMFEGTVFHTVFDAQVFPTGT